MRGYLNDHQGSYGQFCGNNMLRASFSRFFRCRADLVMSRPVFGVELCQESWKNVLELPRPSRSGLLLSF